MKKLIGIILIISGISNAQSFEFSGYYENQLYPQIIKEKVVLQGHNKLRIDLSTDFMEDFVFNGDFIFLANYGAKSYKIQDFLPNNMNKELDGFISTLPEEIKQMAEKSLEIGMENRNYLDNAYITYYSDDFNFRIGKQQLAFGTGYTWNPTDIFNQKNVLDPTYEKEGISALKFEYKFSMMGKVTAIMALEENWKSSSKMINVKEHFGEFDINLNAAEYQINEIDFYNLSEVSNKEWQIGFSTSGQIFGTGIWIEGANYLREDDYNEYQALIGLDYTFENGLYLMSEFLINSRGSDDKDYSINDWLEYFERPNAVLGKSYLMVGERYQITDLINWENYVIYNLSDNSGVIYPSVTASLSNNTELSLMPYVPFGNDRSEFGEFKAGGIFRLKLYF